MTGRRSMGLILLRRDTTTTPLTTRSRNERFAVPLLHLGMENSPDILQVAVAP